MINCEFSIITVCYNAVDTIERTILSVKNQTFRDFEHIIIDGGSNDGTLEIIEKYRDGFSVVVSEPDHGIYDAMNNGIDLALGKWINFMNSGDSFYCNDVLMNINEISKNTKSELIYSDTFFEGRGVFPCDIKRRRIIHQSLFYLKALHRDCGLYLVSKNVSISDYIFFQCCKDKKWCKVDFIIASYDPNGVSSNISHFKQKIAVDILFDNTGRIGGSAQLLLHPLYNRLKKSLQFLWRKV